MIYSQHFEAILGCGPAQHASCMHDRALPGPDLDPTWTRESKCKYVGNTRACGKYGNLCSFFNAVSLLLSKHSGALKFSFSSGSYVYQRKYLGNTENLTKLFSGVPIFSVGRSTSQPHLNVILMSMLFHLP